MKGCGNKCMKYFLVFLNSIFLIIGLALAGVSGYAAFNKHSTIHILLVKLPVTNLMVGLYIMLAVGLFLALLSFMGCFGAAMENTCMLGTYFCLVLVVFIIQLAAVILCFVKYKTIKKDLYQALRHPGSQKPSTKAMVQALKVIQSEAHCCGLKGPSDWSHIPDSCYATTTAKKLHDSNFKSEQILDESRDDNSDMKFDGQSAGVAVKTTKVEKAPPTTTSSTKKPITTSTTTKFTTTKSTITTSTTAKSTTTKSAPAPTSSSSHSKGRLHTMGCLTLLKPGFYAAGGIGIFILFLEITVMVMACLLYSELKNGYSSIA